MSSRLDIPSTTDLCLRPDELRVTMMAITHTGMSRRRSAMESDSSDSSDSASECASVASDTAPTDLTDLSSPPPFYGECSGTGDRSRLAANAGLLSTHTAPMRSRRRFPFLCGGTPVDAAAAVSPCFARVSHHSCRPPTHQHRCRLLPAGKRFPLAVL